MQANDKNGSAILASMMMQLKEALWNQPEATVMVILVLAMTVMYVQKRAGNGQKSWLSEILLTSSSSSSTQQKSPRSTTVPVMKTVFDYNRSQQQTQQAKIAETDNDDTTKSSDRPFGSSYYYAHNNSKVGYKDGLKMEDYVMNQPRLLRKGTGSSLLENVNNGGDNNTTPKTTTESSSSTHESSSSSSVGTTKSVAQQRQQPQRQRVIAMNRYMWDDPGNMDGLAKILIDTLPPSKVGGTALAWEAAHITKENVKVQLVGETELRITIQTSIPSSEASSSASPMIVCYELHIPKLYGTVSDAKIIVKAKRLIVKIQKKKDRLDLWNKTNLKAWPQLSSSK
eukprot:scaffold114242_cov57-Attheya_sp.AAC.1